MTRTIERRPRRHFPAVLIVFAALGVIVVAALLDRYYCPDRPFGFWDGFLFGFGSLVSH